MGLIEPGNIDLKNRPRVKSADGSISTVRSMGFNVGGQEVLLPTVSEDGRIMSNQETLDQYRETGRHLGKFSDVDSSNAYAKQLHNDQAKMIEGEFSPDKYLEEKSHKLINSPGMLDRITADSQMKDGEPFPVPKTPILGSGYEVFQKVKNPYLGTALSTAYDVLPWALQALHGKIPGSAAIKGVKPPVEGVTDASEAFAARGKTPMSPETKLAKMAGESEMARSGLTPAEIGEKAARREQSSLASGFFDKMRENLPSPNYATGRSPIRDDYMSASEKIHDMTSKDLTTTNDLMAALTKGERQAVEAVHGSVRNFYDHYNEFISNDPLGKEVGAKAIEALKPKASREDSMKEEE